MNTQIDSPNRLSLLVAVALCVSLQGCVANLPAVRDFSQNTVVAAGSFDDIAYDLPRSCVRRSELDLSPEEKVTIEGDKVTLSDEYVKELSACDSLKNSLDGMIQVNIVLKAYADALGKLAADDTVTFTQDTDALEASLKKINIDGKNPFAGPKADAVSGLARYLSNAALEGYRQKKLRDTIQAGNQPLQQIVAGLDEVAGDYQAILRNEKQSVVTNQNLIMIQRKKGAKSADLDEKLLQGKQAMDVIDTKVRAADDYKTVLGKIAQAHKSLYISSQANQLDSALLIAEIRKYAIELLPLVNQMRVAFNQ